MAKEAAGKRAKKTKAQIKAYLKARGIKAKDVDDELDVAVDAAAIVRAICKLHGITAAELQAAK